MPELSAMIPRMGATGPAGASVHASTAAPGPGDGNVGDVWLRVDAGSAIFQFYGPKTAEGWPSGISFRGEQGIPGPDGEPGPMGLDGTSAAMRVRVVDDGGGDPATDYEPGDSVDGGVLVENDLVLRATPGGDPADGVYVVPATGAAARHGSFDAYDAHPGTLFMVMDGAAFGGSVWLCTSPRGGTLDTTDIDVEQFLADVVADVSALTALGIATGSYTPSATAVANCDVVDPVPTVCRFTRIGNLVTVYGRVLIDPNAGNTLTTFRLTLPVASTFSANTDLHGIIAGTSTGAVGSGYCIADTSNHEAVLSVYPNNASAVNYGFTFQYVVQ